MPPRCFALGAARSRRQFLAYTAFKPVAMSSVTTFVKFDKTGNVTG
jgi:hypothetical protein